MGALTYVAKGLTPVVFHQYDAPQAFAKGGLVKDAKRLSKAGRHGDDIMLHLSRGELDDLTKILGAPTINPDTGLPEYFSFKKLLKVLGAVAPIALAATGAGGALGSALLPASMATSAWTPVLGNALLGGGVGALTGGKKGALMGGALGGLSAAAAPVIGNVFGGNADTIFGEGAGSGFGSSVSGMFGGGGNEGALSLGVSPDAGTGGSDYVNSLEGAQNGAHLAGEQVGPALGGLDQVARADLPLSTAQTDAGILNRMFPGERLSSDLAAAGLSGENAGSGIMGYIKENPLISGGAALGALGLMGQDAEAPRATAGGVQVANTNWNSPLKTTAFPRRYKGVSDPLAYYNYGTSPFEQYDDNALTGEDESVTAATGGFLQGGALQPSDGGSAGYATGGEGDGRADTIDAKLSNNEYVIDAETVALLGNGSPEAGAQKLDDLRSAVRAHKGKALAKGKISPDAKDAMAYLSA